MSGAILLDQLVGRLAFLDVACSRCKRRGRLRLSRLLAEHGAAFPLPSLKAHIAADCPRIAMRDRDMCGVHYPQLATLFSAWPGG
jgi:hypothetical protein